MEGYLEVYCSKCGEGLLVGTQIMVNGKARVVIAPCQFCTGQNKELRKAIATFIEAAHKPFGKREPGTY